MEMELFREKDGQERKHGLYGCSLCGIKEVLRPLEDECAHGSADSLPELDGKLKEAVLADTAEHAGELVPAVECRQEGTGVHRWREGELFTGRGASNACNAGPTGKKRWKPS